MFSATEYPYLKDLTLTYFNADLIYYVCRTNRVPQVGVSNNYNVADIYCYYSKNPITVNNYTFSIPASSTLCTIDTTAVSANNTINKLTCNNFSGNITIDAREFIYSNVGLFPDFLVDYQNKVEYQTEFMDTSLNNNLTLDHYYAFCVIIALIFMFTWLRGVFK